MKDLQDDKRKYLLNKPAFVIVLRMAEIKNLSGAIMRAVGAGSSYRKLTGDAVVRSHREHLQQFVKTHSEKAAQKLLAALPGRVEKRNLSSERIADLIAEEFKALYE